MEEPTFLTLAEVIEIHKNQIRLYGGDHGIRDIHLLQSVLAQPEASFAGEWLHSDLFEMATAYAFHIAQNHPFIDGNKRAARKYEQKRTRRSLQTTAERVNPVTQILR